MNTWKVTIELDGKTIELTVKAMSFSDAYIKAEMEHPNCRVVHVKKEEDFNKKRF
jgi:hypothetical protein